MKSDIVHINNQGTGFEAALEQAEKTARFRELSEKETLRLRICAEEMLSLARSVTREFQASFWLESEGKKFDLHMSTKTVMDRKKRDNLIASATSRRNEAANSFLGKLRDAFEAVMVSEQDNSIPEDVLDDLANHPIEIAEWDEYEQSILQKVADEVKIAIRGGVVDMTVSKSFE